jgi:hypothetical protein
VAKRKANYAAAIAERSEWKDRLDHLDLDQVAALHKAGHVAVVEALS